MEKEEDNFARAGFAVVYEVQEAVRQVTQFHLGLEKQTFEEYLKNHQHEILHNYAKKCCSKNCKQVHRKAFFEAQMKIMFSVSQIHQEENLKYCHSNVNKGITLKDVDLTYLNTLLRNISPEIFWRSCRKDLEALLNEYKHQLYHAYDKTSCCHCLLNMPKLTYSTSIKKPEWKVLFAESSVSSCQKLSSTNNCICKYTAYTAISVPVLDEGLQKIVLEICCPLRQGIDSLVKIRNRVRGHATDGKMTDTQLMEVRSSIDKEIKKIIEHGVLDQQQKENILKEFEKDLEYRWKQPMSYELHCKIMEHFKEEIRRELSLQEGMRNLHEDNVRIEGKLDDMRERLNAVMLQNRSGVNQDNTLTDTGNNEDMGNDAEEEGYVSTDAVPFTSTDNSVGASASEQPRRKECFQYDALILHAEDDEKDVQEFKKMLMEEIKLPDIRIASSDEDILPGAQIFKGFQKLMNKCSCLILFITPAFYHDKLNVFRMYTQLTNHVYNEDLIIPVLHNETEIRQELIELKNFKHILYYPDKHHDKGKQLIRRIMKQISCSRESSS